MTNFIFAGSQHYRKYLNQLYSRARRISDVYPGWLMRIYHNVTDTDQVATKYLCKLFCHLSHVDLCDVENLPTLGKFDM